jgi:4-hydroxybenzoate polyprenyltransferase
MSGAAARVADATGNWVDTHAPPWSRPYLRLSRLDRPIGSWLLLMPCWWSAALAAGVIGKVGQLPLIIVLFFIGAFVMRGAGCTWNDITDRDLDAMVERTRSRPIPAGQVSVPQAAAFLVVQALIGLAVLLQFNRFAILTGIASLVIVAVYPFMKRITWWPQIVLGLAFSWGALMGFAVTLGRLDAAAFALYAGSIAWVIGYDTIYAHQDAEDDALIGIKSTALLFGARTHQALIAFYGLAVALIAVALELAGAGLPAWIGLAAFATHLVWQIRRLEISDPALCLRIFKSNRDAGLLLFAGLLVDAAMRSM